MSATAGSLGYGARVLRPGELPSTDRGGGAKTTALVTAERGATAFLNGTTQFDPGARIAHHTHNVAESVMVVEGTAIVDIDGKRTRLQRLDTTFVPANVPHHFENPSDSEVMRIFWTYASIDATRTFTQSGTTTRVDHESGGGASTIIREYASLIARPGHEADVEAAVRRAVPLFQAARGARRLRLERLVETPSAYRLIVEWDSIHAHTRDFRSSEAFQQWRKLIGDHLAADPVVEHAGTVVEAF